MENNNFSIAAVEAENSYLCFVNGKAVISYQTREDALYFLMSRLVKEIKILEEEKKNGN